MSTLSAEALKLRTTRATAALAASGVGVVVLAAVVHLLGFPARLVDEPGEQIRILADIGVSMAVLFAAISGSLGITTDYRHGTVRSTLVRRPDRTRLLAAKAVIQIVTCAGIGTLVITVALALAATFVRARGLAFGLSTGELARFVFGTAVASACFAVIGLAVGTIARNQIPVTIGLLVWFLFLENLLRAGTPSVARFAPGSLARAVATTADPQRLAPLLAGAVLAAFAAVLLAVARTMFRRRDLP